MDVKITNPTPLKDKASPDEWQARIDLAACYRLVRLNGWNTGINNHVSHRVPGEEDNFLIKAHPLFKAAQFLPLANVVIPP